MNKYPTMSYTRKATPGLFRGVFTRPGPFGLPSWLPAGIVGERKGWPVNPIGKNAEYQR